MKYYKRDWRKRLVKSVESVSRENSLYIAARQYFYELAEWDTIAKGMGISNPDYVTQALVEDMGKGDFYHAQKYRGAFVDEFREPEEQKDLFTTALEEWLGKN